jgi:hypothetical protein
VGGARLNLVQVNLGSGPIGAPGMADSTRRTLSPRVRVNWLGGSSASCEPSIRQQCRCNSRRCGAVSSRNACSSPTISDPARRDWQWPSTPQRLDVALAYHRSWTSRDFDRAMTYIAEDIVCGGMAALLGGRRSGQGRGLCGR